MKNWMLVATLGLLTACSTNIHAMDESIKPPTVRFSAYSGYRLDPLQVAHMESDASDQQAVARIGTELAKCMAETLPNNGGGRQVIITPTITDLKKVNTSERVFLGAMAGSSAVLLNVKYTDASTNTVIANPTFYARAAAMSGAFTFGSEDNKMLTRIVDNACDYTKQYR